MAEVLKEAKLKEKGIKLSQRTYSKLYEILNKIELMSKPVCFLQCFPFLFKSDYILVHTNSNFASFETPATLRGAWIVKGIGLKSPTVSRLY